MNRQESALVQVARLLEDGGVPYMIIGGMANAIWGVPRATLDVDVTVWTGSSDPTALIALFDGPFRIRPADPVSFVLDTRVLPVETLEGVRVDVVLGLLPFEEEAIRRSVLREVGDWHARFCTAEDLVLLKILSERPRDLDDVRAIIGRQAAFLDRAYLDPRVRELSDLLERPEIEQNYRQWLELAARGVRK